MTEIHITPDGDVQFVWDDELADLCDLGVPAVQRASHVEPDASGHWTADLRPVGGPVLGPYRLRSEALAAERAWLDQQLRERVITI